MATLIEKDKPRTFACDLPLVLQYGCPNPQSRKMETREVGLVNDYWSMRFDPFTIGGSICGFVLICNVIVLLSSVSQAGGASLSNARHTSSCSAVNSLYAALASFITAPNSLRRATRSLPSTFSADALSFSVINTFHAAVTN